MADPFEIDASGPLLDVDPEHARIDADFLRAARDAMAIAQETTEAGPDSIMRAVFREAAGPLADIERALREAAEA